MRKYSLYTPLILCLSVFSLQAQLFSPVVKSSAAYYLDLNQPINRLGVSAVQDGFLYIKYEDVYGRNSEMILTVLDGFREHAKFRISKAFGLNYYMISLDDMAEEWEEDHLYRLVGKDEQDQKLEICFKRINPIDTAPPSVSIFVNPLTVKCEKSLPSSISYLATIEGGKSPYEITWYVLRDDQRELLFQPRQEKVFKPGNTPMITVDAALDYHVMIHVKDACGAEQKQMVHMVCEEEQDQVNTIFIQPMANPPVYPGN